MLFSAFHINGIDHLLVCPELPGIPIYRDSAMSQFQLPPLLPPEEWITGKG
jgi:hypothetical protein